MKAWLAIAAVAAAWFARGRLPDEVDVAKAPTERPVEVASARAAPAHPTVVAAAMPRLELPIEPPTLVDANPELPPAEGRTIQGAIYELGGEPCIGATVVATSPALEGEQVVITDEEGLYKITGLPPGAYALIVYYNNERIYVAGYDVRDDEATLAELVFDPVPEPPREVVAFENRVVGRDFIGVVDCPDGDCTIHSNCGNENTYILESDDDTENTATADDVPVPGRTFETVLGAAAGSQPGG
jgi:carboxypeptidase family protein